MAIDTIVYCRKCDGARAAREEKQPNGVWVYICKKCGNWCGFWATNEVLPDDFCETYQKFKAEKEVIK